MTKHDAGLAAQIESYVSQLQGLIARGGQLREKLAQDPADASVMAATRAWQEQCGAAINQLSGGSKAHWLARSFSQAFLVRSDNGQAAEGVAATEIIDRLIAVLEQAIASLSQTENKALFTAAQTAAPRRFEFVHNAELRPVLEQAYIDSRQAFEEGKYDESLRVACGVLEALVTDALEHKGEAALAAAGAPAGKIADWSFRTRIAVAEKAGVIRGGCARLPQAAWTYRETADEVKVSERDAKVTGQVLNVVIRDLDPGR